MTRQIINTNNAPAAIGPYAQAVAAGNFVFVSGQIPIDPKTGNLVASDIKVQTRQVLENLKAVLLAAGSNLNQVVKTQVFMKDLNDFAAMNEVYAEYFGTILPARATVQVVRLPRDVMVEIDAVAVKQ